MVQIVYENTYVVYEDGDLLGEFLAFITLFPIHIMVMFTTLILFRRDFSTIFATIGICVNLLVNKVLKKLVSQPRPLGSTLSGNGMPSNHSQVMGFIVIFYSLQFLLNSPTLRKSVRWQASCGIILLTILVCYSRSYLNYHTVEQIVVGVSVGGFVGLWWYLLDCFCGHALGELVCSIPIVRKLGVRNFSPLEQYVNLRRKPKSS